MTSGRGEWGWRVGYCVLFACAMGMLCFALDTFPGLSGTEAEHALSWGGETLTGEIDKRFVLQRMQSRESISEQPPHYLMVALMRLAREFWGATPFSIRLPSVLLALLACLALVLMVRRLEPQDSISPWIYLLAMAVHPMFLGYSRMGWETSPSMIGAVLVWMPWFLKREQISRVAFWGWSVLGAGLLLLAHPVYLVFLGCLGSVALWQQGETLEAPWQRVLRGGLVVVWSVGTIGMLAWIFQNVGAYRYFLWTIRFVWHIVEVLTGVRIFQYITGIYWSFWHSMLVVTTAIVFVVAAMSLYEQRRRWLWWCLWVLGLNILCFYLLLPWLFYSIGHSRYMLILVFPFCFLLAAGLDAMPNHLGRSVLLVYAGFVLVGFAQGYFVEGWKRENLRASAVFWTGAEPGDPEPKLKASRWIQTHIPNYKALQLPIYTASRPAAKALQYYLQQPILRYWTSTSRGLIEWDWAEMPRWVVVEFDVKAAPFWRLLKHLRRIGVPYQMHPIRTRLGRVQMWVVTSLPKTQTHVKSRKSGSVERVMYSLPKAQTPSTKTTGAAISSDPTSIPTSRPTSIR